MKVAYIPLIIIILMAAAFGISFLTAWLEEKEAEDKHGKT